MTIDEILADVERVADAPMVISPYGFKKTTISGKNVLVPMSKEEFETLVRGVTRDKFDPKMLAQNCYTQPGGLCYPAGCTGHCQYGSLGGGGFGCFCVF